MLYSQLQEVDVLSRDSVSPKDRSTDYFRKRNKLNRNTAGDVGSVRSGHLTLPIIRPILYLSLLDESSKKDHLFYRT